MARKRYWNGFTTGAAVGVAASLGTLLTVNLIGRRRHKLFRLEKSLQIGKPLEEVFNRWANLEHLSELSPVIQEIRRYGDTSHWKVNANGKHLEWDAEIEQLIPNQSIGWKSTSGPKHTGRISFSPLGNDTLVHLTMNYAPPMRLLRPFMSPLTGRMEGVIEQVLRDFKASLEGRTQTAEERGTGTYGSSGRNY